MIKEAYVSFEVAKLLKEKGFEQETPTRYAIGKITESWYDDYRERVLSFEWEKGYFVGIEDIKHDIYGETISAPTHQMAMAWLREIHKLSIEPFYYPVLGYCVEIKHIGKETGVKEFEEIRDKSYNSYEEAVEAGLLFVLKNII